MGIFELFGRSKPTPDKIPVKTDAPQSQGKGRAAIARDAVREPRSIKELVEKIESDPQFLLGKLVIKSLVCSAKVAIECDEQYRDDADQLTELWEKTLPHAFECFGYGRVCFELRYGAYENGRRPIAGLDPLPFEDTEMILDDAGEFTGVKIKAKQESFQIDAACVWWCALDATAKQPHGRSRYRGAPLKVWKWRQESDHNWSLFEKKHAIGHGVIRAPSAYPNNMLARGGDVGEVSKDSKPADPMEDAAVMIDALMSGGSAVLPSEVDPVTNTPYFSYDPPTTRLDASPIENRRRVLDAMALRSLGVPERAVTQDEATGSYSMAEVHWKVLARTCEEILLQIADSFQTNVVDRWTQQNFGSHTKFFVTSQPIIDASKQLVTDILRAIFTGSAPSPLITGGVVDLGKLLEIADLPAGDGLAEKLAKISQDIAAQAAATSFGQTGGPPSTPAFPRLASLRRLAIGGAIEKPPIDDTWEDIADQAINETLSLSKEIKHLPQSAEAGRLLRPDSRSD